MTTSPRDFRADLEWSAKEALDTVPFFIQDYLPDCTKVESLRGRGKRFLAHMKDGSVKTIDHKSIGPGRSEYWKHGPEIPLETWSVVGTPGKPGTVGWTLDQSRKTDYILYTFDPTDYDSYFMVPFPDLRMIFRRMQGTWRNVYGARKQTTRKGHDVYQSECITVPIADIETLQQALQEARDAKEQARIAEELVRKGEEQLARAKAEAETTVRPAPRVISRERVLSLQAGDFDIEVYSRKKKD